MTAAIPYGHTEGLHRLIDIEPREREQSERLFRGTSQVEVTENGSIINIAAPNVALAIARRVVADQASTPTPFISNTGDLCRRRPLLL